MRTTVLLLCFSLVACSSETAATVGDGGARDGAVTDGSTTDTPPLACVPGASVACTGPSGCAGGQSCLADGTGYGACDCGAPGDAGAADVATVEAGQGDAGAADALAADDATQTGDAAIGGVCGTGLTPTPPWSTIPAGTCGPDHNLSYAQCLELCCDLVIACFQGVGDSAVICRQCLGFGPGAYPGDDTCWTSGYFMNWLASCGNRNMCWCPN